MKKWIRIIFVCFVLIGGTAFFAYQLLNQFNDALDNLSASSLAISKIPPVPLSNKTNKEQISTSTPEAISTSTPEIILTSTLEAITTSATSTDFKPSFIFPNIYKDVYIGCTYRLSFQLSTTIRSLETVLVDAGLRDTIESVASGLAKEYKIEPNSQSLDWKVGKVWPGKYYIKVSDINGIIRSKVFTIRQMPKDISTDEIEKICKESDGFLL